MKPLTKTTVTRGGGMAARFAVVNNEPAAKETVANPVANAAKPEKPKDRVTRWREANPELYKERQAKYQANYRRRKAAKPT